MAANQPRGLADVVAASTALTEIHMRAGRLFNRGYDINELAGGSCLGEIGYLLQRGSARGRGGLAGYRAGIEQHADRRLIGPGSANTGERGLTRILLEAR